MSPELEQLKREVALLRAEVKKLAAFNTIPFPVEKAFRTRLGITKGIQTQITDSGDDPANYAVTINEAGTGTEDVLPVSEYMLLVDIGNSVTVAVPAYDR